jgi:hypothetical protein
VLHIHNGRDSEKAGLTITKLDLLCTLQDRVRSRRGFSPVGSGQRSTGRGNVPMEISSSSPTSKPNTAKWRWRSPSRRTFTLLREHQVDRFACCLGRAVARGVAPVQRFAFSRHDPYRGVAAQP